MEQRSEIVRNSDSDIDFNDVFGGPPMWTRYSYGGSRMKSLEETAVSPSGPVERPVFGEMYSSPRRRTSDVFRSDESVRWGSPTPRSLPAKMTKAAETPVFGSNVHAQNNHLSKISSPATQILRNNSGRYAGRTMLSRESSSAKESLYSTRSTEKDVDRKSKARTGSSSIEFHFSMHKWANVGVPSLMSLHEGTHPGSSKVSVLSLDNMQDSRFPNEDASAENQEVKSSLLHDEIERKGFEEAGTKESMKAVSGKKKLEANKMNSSNKAGANKPGVGSPKTRVKVMVKDLFKMPSQVSPPKTKTKVSSIWTTRDKEQTQEEVADIISNMDTNAETMTDSLETTDLARELPAESVNAAPDASVTIPLDSRVPADDGNMMPDASFMVKEEIKRSNSAQNRTIRTLEDIHFQKDALPASDSVPNGSEASVETRDSTIDEPSLDHFWVEELAPVASEAIMALDSKIHMWSSGRTGNIRSLLSTLQLVLWAESRWKPVALADIIDENALKKSYNRAMLCLHPDKLQQKGTDSHNKYIAEKVLVILQEAWDHLN